MTYNCEVSDESNLVTVTPKGTYSLKSIIDLIHIVIKDPQYKSTYDLLVDLRDMKYTPIVSEIFAISEFVVSFKQYFKGKTALVAKGELLYSMFKLSAMFVAKQGLKTNIFHEPEEALAWIADQYNLKFH